MFKNERLRQCTELYAALRDSVRHCNSALSLLFLLRIQQKRERLSAQIFTRRYEMVRDTVKQIERRVRSKSKHSNQDERSERASTEKADHSEQANQTPSQLACAWCARCVFFCTRRGSLEKYCGATRAHSLCFIS